MQGAQVRSLVRELYPTCHEAAKPVPICRNKEPEQPKIILKKERKKTEPAPGINSPQDLGIPTDFLGNCAVGMR